MITELRLSLVKTSWKEGELNGLLCMRASQGLSQQGTPFPGEHEGQVWGGREPQGGLPAC